MKRNRELNLCEVCRVDAAEDACWECAREYPEKYTSYGKSKKVNEKLREMLQESESRDNDGIVKAFKQAEAEREKKKKEKLDSFWDKF